MVIYLIRHGMTRGNAETRYIGRTDEPLCEEGRKQLKTLNYPRCELLVCSPMKRCVESAEILFAGQPMVLCDELREVDFGDFEGKNHAELDGGADYQAWIDSGGNKPFPNGEAPDDFRRRCCEGFLRTVTEHSAARSIAFVVHGGTIMSVLDRFAVPHRSYYEWLCGNGRGYRCVFDGKNIFDTERS